MARISVASLLTAVILATPLAFGCTASFQAGGGAPASTTQAPPPAEPPPAAPAATPTPAPAATPATVAPASAVKQEGNKLKMPGAINFDFGKATLKTDSEPVLEQLRQFLEANPKITLIRVEGHTDNVGQTGDNLKLSGERALTVRTWLVNHKIDPKRLIAVGFGDGKPIADNRTKEGQDQNRRTEFVICELSGKAWFGAVPDGGGTVFGENPRK